MSSWPGSGLWVIGLFIGIDMIFDGWTEVMLALSSGSGGGSASAKPRLRDRAASRASGRRRMIALKGFQRRADPFRFRDHRIDR